MKPDRYSEQFARQTVESFLPDASVRRQWLEIFASSILKAHAANPRSWAVTILPGGKQAVRLTVGMIYVCNLYPDGASLTLYAPRQDINALRPYLLPENLAGLENVRRREPHPVPTAPHFPSLPEAVWCWFAAASVTQIWSLAKDAYNETIALAQKQFLNPGARRAHAPGVLAYLRQELGWAIPNPDHTSSASRRRNRNRTAVSIGDPWIAEALRQIEERERSLYQDD